MYSADLAYVHDAGFGDFAERAAPELIRMLRVRGIRPATGSGRTPRIVEIGCGSGILARHLVDAGFDVIGLDRSPDMIRLARKKVPEATFRVASLTRAKIPRGDAAFAIGEVVAYVSASLRPFFQRVHDALAPGGVFIFDFLESAERRTYGPKTFGGSDWALVARADADATGRILTRRMTILRKVGGRYRRSRETHRLRIRSREEIGAALAAAGFSFDMRRAYCLYRLRPGGVAVTALKG